MLQTHYYNGFEKRFGFTNETFEAKLWPGAAEGQILWRNLGEYVPGLRSVRPQHVSSGPAHEHR